MIVRLKYPSPENVFDYYINQYSPDDYEKWVIFLHLGHFVIYDKETKACMYDIR